VEVKYDTIQEAILTCTQKLTNHDYVYVATVMTKVIAIVHPVHLISVTERRVAANHHIKPVDLGCESFENWQLPSPSTITIVIITQPVG